MSASSGPSPVLFCTELALRWRDLDAYDHVNNSVFLSLLEEARIRWFATLPAPWRTPEAEPVLARAEVNYRLPIRYPATVRVELQVARVGRSSLALGHVLSDAQSGLLYSDGATVLVWVAPQGGHSVPLPEVIRHAALAAVALGPLRPHAT